MLRLLFVLMIACSGCSLGADLAAYTPADASGDTNSDLDATPPDTVPDTPENGCSSPSDCPGLAGARAACGEGGCEYVCEDGFVDLNDDLQGPGVPDGCECQSAGAERCETPEDDNCDGRVNEGCCEVGGWTQLPSDPDLQPPRQPAVVVGPDATTLVAWTAVNDDPDSPTSTVHVVVLSHDLSVLRAFNYGFEEKQAYPRLAAGPEGFLVAFSSSARLAIVWHRLSPQGEPSGDLPRPFHSGADAAVGFDVGIISGSPILVFLSRDAAVCATDPVCLAMTGPDSNARQVGDELTEGTSMRSVDLHASGDSYVFAADLNTGSGKSQVHWFQSREGVATTNQFPIDDADDSSPIVGAVAGRDESLVVRLVPSPRRLRPRLEWLDQGVGFVLAGENEATAAWAVQTAADAGALWYEPAGGLFYRKVDSALTTAAAVQLDGPLAQAQYAVSGNAPWGGFVVVRADAGTIAIRAFSPEGDPVCPALN
jgi:hypothetical protein